MGRVPWNKGKKGVQKHSEATKKKIGEAFKGKKLSKEHRHKISLARKGMMFSEKHKHNLSEAKKGAKNPNWEKFGEKHHNWGYKHSKETLDKISKASSGERNPQWRGGSSLEPYGPDFNEALRRKIRERDKYTCQLCGAFGKRVHHIDYDKKNNAEKNLINLGERCHNKTNHNRFYWPHIFNSLLPVLRAR
ncbi:hypothetical protein ES703_112855 [subsurface metagenome]